MRTGAAPPPAQQQQGGGGMMGMASSMFGTMAQGAAIGAGSEVGHRAMGAILGPRGGSQQAAPQQEQATALGVCGNQQQQLVKCLEAHNGDMGACEFFFSALKQCKNGA